MKIGFDGKRALQNNTGLGNYSRFILDSLITNFPSNSYSLFAPQKTSLYQNEAIEFHFPTKFYSSFPAFWRSKGILKDLKKFNIDVFHGLSNELPFGIDKAGITSVVTIHDLIFERFPALYKPIDRKIYRFKFKKASSEASKIIAISNQTKLDLIQFYRIPENKIEVVYQNCHSQFYTLLAPEKIKSTLTAYEINSPYILCVGSIEARKNQLNLVKAFHQLNIDDHILVLIGKSTKYQIEIENYIQENRLESKIKIINNVNFNDLPAIYQGTSVFCYPSIFEGFGIPIIEALHSKVPVLTSTGSCFAEAGGEAAYYADPNNVLEIAENLRALLTDSNARTSLLQNAASQLKKFEAKKIASEINAIYNSI